jgi:hypothetical protein
MNFMRDEERGCKERATRKIGPIAIGPLGWLEKSPSASLLAAGAFAYERIFLRKAKTRFYLANDCTVRR